MNLLKTIWAAKSMFTTNPVVDSLKELFKAFIDTTI